MHISKTWFASLAVCLAAAGVVAAEDSMKSPAHTPQKKIESAFLNDLVGTWTTESTSNHGGVPFKGKGKTTYARGIGDTALLQTYETELPGPDGGGKLAFYGHGVSKVSDDGRTLNVWWFCNMTSEPMKLSGPLTDDGFTITGDGPQGKMTIELKRTPEGLAFRGTEPNGEVMTETYTRAR